MIPWTGITHLGDVGITSLVALAIAAWLIAEDEPRLALCWALLFAAALVVVTATKMAFIGWGIGIRPLNFTGFSGHAVRAAAVAPVLLYLLLNKAGPATRLFGVLCGFAFAALIGISRLAVHTHSVSEVVGGWLLGSAVSLAFIGIAAPMHKTVFSRLRIALVLLALLPAPYVQPTPTQQWLTKVTLYLSGHEQPFRRHHWRAAES